MSQQQARDNETNVPFCVWYFASQTWLVYFAAIHYGKCFTTTTDHTRRISCLLFLMWTVTAASSFQTSHFL
jgi:hypothetical protein